ncbi:MAG: FAD-binding protein [Vicingaceae bacterium]
MPKTFDLRVPLGQEPESEKLKLIAAKQLQLQPEHIQEVRLLKRSIDARKTAIKVQLRYAVYVEESYQKPPSPFPLKKVGDAQEVHLIGFGPAGIFAALQLISQGLKPIVFERGKDVRARRRDLAKLNKEEVVNPESNYCFGEGGAGTYSDGKLYTRSKKRGDVDAILQTLVDFGADENILVEAHPHIGTNKLPQIIVALRDAIIEAGGEVHFERKLTDLKLKNNQIEAIQLNRKNWVAVDQLLLGTGHSARDIFELLHQKNIEVQAKPFALGVRVEHPQSLIDKIQYQRDERGEHLPPAAYRIVKQVEGKGVYSFCMCPGGVIAPCATSPEEVVTNGWSPSRRNNPFANSGIVVSLEEKDWKKHESFGPLAAMRFQAEIEHKAYQAVNETAGQKAPAQRLVDFVKGRPSANLPPCSYFPGIVPARLDLILPPFIAKRLQKAFQQFGKAMKGYLTNEAVVVGVESRTSSPVQIPRDRVNFQHTQISNLYPCGEGAGYAGGIVSAAIDGVKAAKAIAKKVGGETQPKQP